MRAEVRLREGSQSVLDLYLWDPIYRKVKYGENCGKDLCTDNIQRIECN